jgi:hypothetical protein
LDEKQSEIFISFQILISDISVQINGDNHDDIIDGNVDVRLPLPSVDDDYQSIGSTIDDVNLAFENVIAEAEQVVGDEKGSYMGNVC